MVAVEFVEHFEPALRVALGGPHPEAHLGVVLGQGLDGAQGCDANGTRRRRLTPLQIEW